MKKIITAAVIVSFALGFAGCAKKQPAPQPTVVHHSGGKV